MREAEVYHVFIKMVFSAIFWVLEFNDISIIMQMRNELKVLPGR